MIQPCEKCNAESGKPASGSTPIALTVRSTRNDDRPVRSTRIVDGVS